MSKTFHYCAFCRSPKYVYSKTALSFWTFCLIFLASSLSSYGLRRQFDEYVFGLFFLFLIIVELAVKVRYRISLRCKECGFDPLVYKKSSALAVDRVKECLASRASDPKNLLKARLHLPHISSERKLFWERLQNKQVTFNMMDSEDAAGYKPDASEQSVSLSAHQGKMEKSQEALLSRTS